jgi:hypothetical protein
MFTMLGWEIAEVLIQAVKSCLQPLEVAKAQHLPEINSGMLSQD